MNVRIYLTGEKPSILSVFSVDNTENLMRSLEYSKKNEIPITINCTEMPEEDLEEYWVEDYSLTFPKLSKSDVDPYLSVYVAEE